MLCPKCKKDIKDSAKVCGYCGAKLIKSKMSNQTMDLPVVPDVKLLPTEVVHTRSSSTSIKQNPVQPTPTKATTIRLNGTLATNRDMGDLYAKAIEAFQKLLAQEGCQMIRVDSQNERSALLGRTQMITVTWSGDSYLIKSSYEAFPNYVFGLVASVNLQ